MLAAQSLDERELDRLQTLYQSNRASSTRSHLVIAPHFYAGERCSSGASIFSCRGARETRAGIGAVALLPVLGAGGGHGLDWWPAVATDDEGDRSRRLELEFRRVRDRFVRPLEPLPSPDAAEPVIERRFERLVTTFQSVLTRSTSNRGDGDLEREANALKACLDALAQAPTARASDSSTSRPDPGPLTPAAACIEGSRTGVAARSWTATEKLTLLDSLWQKYDLLADRFPLQRHHLLFGPLAGLTLTEGFGDLTYGAGFELGWRGIARFTFGGGLRSSMRGDIQRLGFDSVGWWVGVGLSGQVADRLIDAASGAGDSSGRHPLPE